MYYLTFSVSQKLCLYIDEGLLVMVPPGWEVLVSIGLCCHPELRVYSKVRWAVGRTQFLMVVDWRFLLSCWLLAMDWSRILSVALRS